MGLAFLGGFFTSIRERVNPSPLRERVIVEEFNLPSQIDEAKERLIDLFFHPKYAASLKALHRQRQHFKAVLDKSSDVSDQQKNDQLQLFDRTISDLYYSMKRYMDYRSQVKTAHPVLLRSAMTEEKAQMQTSLKVLSDMKFWTMLSHLNQMIAADQKFMKSIDAPMISNKRTVGLGSKDGKYHNFTGLFASLLGREVHTDNYVQVVKQYQGNQLVEIKPGKVKPDKSLVHSVSFEPKIYQAGTVIHLPLPLNTVAELDLDQKFQHSFDGRTLIVHETTPLTNIRLKLFEAKNPVFKLAPIEQLAPDNDLAKLYLSEANPKAALQKHFASWIGINGGDLVEIIGSDLSIEEARDYRLGNCGVLTREAAYSLRSSLPCAMTGGFRANEKRELNASATHSNFIYQDARADLVEIDPSAMTRYNFIDLTLDKDDKALLETAMKEIRAAADPSRAQTLRRRFAYLLRDVLFKEKYMNRAKSREVTVNDFMVDVAKGLTAEELVAKYGIKNCNNCLEQFKTQELDGMHQAFYSLDPTLRDKPGRELFRTLYSANYFFHFATSLTKFDSKSFSSGDVAVNVSAGCLHLNLDQMHTLECLIKALATEDKVLEFLREMDSIAEVEGKPSFNRFLEVLHNITESSSKAQLYKAAQEVHPMDFQGVSSLSLRDRAPFGEHDFDFNYYRSANPGERFDQKLYGRSDKQYVRVYKNEESARKTNQSRIALNIEGDIGAPKQSMNKLIELMNQRERVLGFDLISYDRLIKTYNEMELRAFLAKGRKGILELFEDIKKNIFATRVFNMSNKLKTYDANVMSERMAKSKIPIYAIGWKGI